MLKIYTVALVDKSNSYTNLLTVTPEHSVLLCSVIRKPHQLHAGLTDSDCSEVLDMFWLYI